MDAQDQHRPPGRGKRRRRQAAAGGALVVLWTAVAAIAGLIATTTAARALAPGTTAQSMLADTTPTTPDEPAETTPATTPDEPSETTPATTPDSGSGIRPPRPKPYVPPTEQTQRVPATTIEPVSLGPARLTFGPGRATITPVTAKTHVITVPITCAANRDPCIGSLRINVGRKPNVLDARRTITTGSIAFSLTAGSRVRLSLPITGTGRRLVSRAKQHQLGIKAAAVINGAAPQLRSITLVALPKA